MLAEVLGEHRTNGLGVFGVNFPEGVGDLRG